MPAVRRTLVVLVVLVLLAVLADTGTRILAQRAVAQQLTTGQGLTTTPEVTIHGTPFLTQALSGQYERVEVSTGPINVTRGAGLTRVDAEFSGVRAPLDAIVGGTIKTIPVRSATAAGVIGFDTLTGLVAASLPAEITDVRLRRTGPGAVEVSARYEAAGIGVELVAPMKLAFAGGRLRVSVDPRSLTQVPAALRRPLAAQLSATVAVPRLPYGLRVSGVTVGDDGVEVTADGRDLTLSASPAAAVGS